LIIKTIINELTFNNHLLLCCTMEQRLVRIIKTWEIKSGFSVSTLFRVLRGDRPRPQTAFAIARALGCSEDDAEQIARELISKGDQANRQTA